MPPTRLHGLMGRVGWIRVSSRSSRWCDGWRGRSTRAWSCMAGVIAPISGAVIRGRRRWWRCRLHGSMRVVARRRRALAGPPEPVSLLENEPRSVGHAWLMWWRARERLYAGDCGGAAELADEAGRLAQKFGDADLEVLACWYGGRALIGCGRLDLGFQRIDEAMAASAGGESSVLVAGAVYCLTVAACRELADYRRASEWTQSQARWCRERAVPVFPSFCRVNRAAILRMSGDWTQAEQEAAAAAEENWV